MLTAHSPRYEARLKAAWRDLCATVDVPHAERKVAQSPACRQAAVARALRESPGLRRLPLVKAVLAE